jgi:LuxR family maltose regulon positive regulatory protein
MKTSHQKRYYLSDRLNQHLSSILDYPVSLVDAFSGLGKTSAIREYFKHNLPEDAKEYWYTCLYDSADIAWRDICDIFALFDKHTAEQMRLLHMPTRDTLLQFSAIIAKLHCNEETYLIIDNFHLARCSIPNEVIDVFSAHLCPKLHIVFISQHLREKRIAWAYNDNVYEFDSSIFMFTSNDLDALLKLEGLCIPHEHVAELYYMSEGWPAAIAFQIEKYKQTNAFYFNEYAETFIENVFWNQLSMKKKRILLSLSILGDVTPRQAAIMINLDTLPNDVERFLQYNDLVRYHPEQNKYHMNRILQIHLKKRFHKRSSDRFQNRVLNNAGYAYSDMQQYHLAAQCYLMAKNYESILSLPFHIKDIWDQDRRKFLRFLTRLLDQCPEEILCKYPDTLIKFTYTICMEDEHELLQRLSNTIDLAIKKNYIGLCADELAILQNEWLLLQSFFAYTNVEEVYAVRRKVFSALKKPSKFTICDMPWTFGDTSILCNYWCESNKLDQVINYMDVNLPYYLHLKRGHGSGASTALRAETLLMRGQDIEAEILCYKALEEAKAHEQIAICLCVGLVLARIAILRGDTKQYLQAYNYIRSYMNDDADTYIIQMVEACLLVLAMVLKDKDCIPESFYSEEKRTNLNLSKPYYQILKSEILLFDEQYVKVCGTARYVTELSNKPTYLLQIVYNYIFLAVGNQAIGQLSEAKTALREALLIALPDKIYLPFATHWPEISSLFQNPEEFLEKELINERLDDLLITCNRQLKGINIIKKAVLQSEKLSSREKEIAHLARENLSNKEIADMLFISDKTVKTILNNIFKKLEIHKRSDLSKKIL